MLTPTGCASGPSCASGSGGRTPKAHRRVPVSDLFFPSIGAGPAAPFEYRPAVQSGGIPATDPGAAILPSPHRMGE